MGVLVGRMGTLWGCAGSSRGFVESGHLPAGYKGSVCVRGLRVGPPHCPFSHSLSENTQINRVLSAVSSPCSLTFTFSLSRCSCSAGPNFKWHVLKTKSCHCDPELGLPFFAQTCERKPCVSRCCGVCVSPNVCVTSNISQPCC